MSTAARRAARRFKYVFMYPQNGVVGTRVVSRPWRLHRGVEEGAASSRAASRRPTAPPPRSLADRSHPPRVLQGEVGPEPQAVLVVHEVDEQLLRSGPPAEPHAQQVLL